MHVSCAKPGENIASAIVKVYCQSTYSCSEVNLLLDTHSITRQVLVPGATGSVAADLAAELCLLNLRLS